MSIGLSSTAVKLFGVLLAAVALCACAQHAARPTESTSTNFDAFVPPGALRMQPKPNQKVVLGGPVEQAAPVYPSQMVKKKILRQSVCLSIAIDRKGAVYQVGPVHGMPGCPSNAATIEPAFVDAARVAVMHWRFTPTVICTFPKGVDASTRSDDCVGAKIIQIPIRLAFIFTFTQTRGVTNVHAGRVTR